MKPVVIYSIQSWLAYHINEEYYNSIHYVWCAPCFDAKIFPSTAPRIAPTSEPRRLYNELNRDIYAKDNHYIRSAIDRNIVGLTGGAEEKLKASVISATQRDEILGLINAIEKNKNYEYFRPLIYVIPFESIEPRINRVNFNKTALPLSPEYLITDLHTKEFDIIDLNKEGEI